MLFLVGASVAVGVEVFRDPTFDCRYRYLPATLSFNLSNDLP